MTRPGLDFDPQERRAAGVPRALQGAGRGLASVGAGQGWWCEFGVRCDLSPETAPLPAGTPQQHGARR
ncbi:hypothetical protein SAMN02745121_07062 [Nannocystis exedens]|uniref:Uncharacterized protein n=1 Tax=Nannocystis exedens TaxID=54 RepID=A0A1I2G6R7_9BACT|nr:hypothetical protein NAEX_00294 [Nannocystis exedens]SFF12647.1 hypothetical protein SAMN02745121_07062 [Nannocystis exedens]